MKHLLFLGLMSIMTLSFIACSSDNEDDPKENSGLDKESETIINKYQARRSLIGSWSSNVHHKPSFVFLSDGTCLLDGPYTTGYTVGVWEYNESTKLLSTTCGAWAWTINILTENEWSGMSPGGTSYSYNRSGWNDPNDELMIGEWINKETGITFAFYAGQKYRITTPENTFNGTYEVNTYTPSGWEEYHYCRYIYLKGDVAGKMRVNSLDGYRLVFSTDEGYTGTEPYRLSYTYKNFNK